ncbi:MAG: type III CRISPR-associated RAMP protein Csx7 [Candidatus Asgardarchaeia archaeon]
MIGHDYIVTSISMKGEIVAKMPIYIGSGQSITRPAAVDMEFIRLSTVEGKIFPYIPGSSIKGVLRSTCERIIKSIKNPQIRACNIPSNSCIDNDKEKIIKESLLKEPEVARKMLEENLCEVCKIFGNQVYSSHMLINDAIGVQWSFGIRPGIAINREYGSVEHGPFFVEYVAPGSVFSFEILARNLEPYQLGLIAAAIQEINKGRIKVGGLKSRGFGTIEIIFHDINYETYDSRYSIELPKSPPPDASMDEFKTFTERVLEILISR